MQTADLVIIPERQCVRSDGLPKQGYASFDDAFAQIAAAVGRHSARTHVYRCPYGHGWHLAKNPLKAPQ